MASSGLSLSRPEAPEAKQITHYSIYLDWTNSLNAAIAQIGNVPGSSRVQVLLYQMSPGFTESWKAAYMGYASQFLLDKLTPWTQYKFKIRFSTADNIQSDWSPDVIYTTLQEPLNGENIHKAIRMQDVNLLRRVLSMHEAPLNAPDQFGFTALMVTAFHSYKEMMQLLLEDGADVNFQNEIGKTALMSAAFHAQLDSVKLLRQYGANYELRDIGGSTALHWACDSRSPQVVDWMLLDGANISATDSNGRTPLLHLASLSGNRDIAAVLIRHGADVNAVDKNKQTALMLAAVGGHASLIEYLLDRSADVTVVNQFGKTAYDMALSMDKQMAAKTLRNFMDKNGIQHR